VRRELGVVIVTGGSSGLGAATAAAVTEAGGELIRDGATARFTAALAGANAPVFDPLPAMRAAPSGPDLFFQQTVHLTPRGHEVFAAALEEFLRGAGLLDPPPGR